jgi:hypothetical protein
MVVARQMKVFYRVDELNTWLKGVGKRKDMEVDVITPLSNAPGDVIFVVEYRDDI